jgi:hypothetical protein
MAIVLEVSLTLNPNNQIAYLADFTSLEEDTEYLITGTYLTYDTRFSFRGFADITLTKPPIGVPTAGTIIPAEISTVPLAAPAPLPATYPYSINERIVAASLNADFEFSPGAVPPHSNLGGAGKFKYWVDTSTTLPSLRQCIVPRASATYNAAEWLTLGTIDAAAGKFHLNGSDVDFVGGEAGGATIFNVTNLTVLNNTTLQTLVVQGSTTLTTLQVTGGTTLQTLTVSGASTLGAATASSLNVSGATTLAGLTVNGNESVTGDITTLGVRYSGLSGNRFAFSWDGHVQAYVDGGRVGTIPSSLPVPIGEGGTSATTAGQGLANLGGLPLSGGTISGSLGITGNLQVNGNINCARIDADYVYSRGNMAAVGRFDANNVFTNYLNTNGAADISGHLQVNGGMNLNGGMTVGGNAGFNSPLIAAGGLYGSNDGTLYVYSHIVPPDNGGHSCGVGGLAWLNVVSYNFVNPSSAEIKDEIRPVEIDKCLDIVKSLNPVTYRYIAEKMPAKERAQIHCGFTAQDVLAVFEQHGFACNAVHRSDDGELIGLAYNELIGLLWGAVRALSLRMEA